MATLAEKFGIGTGHTRAVSTANLLIVVSEKKHEIERNAAAARARLRERDVPSLLADDYADAPD